eukprot:12801-Heterococcus_DN1.PRE.2
MKRLHRLQATSVLKASNGVHVCFALQLAIFNVQLYIFVCWVLWRLCSLAVPYKQSKCIKCLKKSCHA